MIADSLNHYDEDDSVQGLPSWRKTGLTEGETSEYLQGFNYRLGEREKKAMETFRELVEELDHHTPRRSTPPPRRAAERTHNLN